MKNFKLAVMSLLTFGTVTATTTFVTQQSVHAYSATTLTKDVHGKWYKPTTHNNRVDAYYTGLVAYKNRWFYVKNGYVDWSFTGIAQNPVNKRWFYVNKGVLDWSFTGIAQNPVNKRWFYIHKGSLDWNFTGIAQNPVNKRWFYVNKGVLDWSFTGIAQNPVNKRWFYIHKGSLDWNFTGIAQNPINKRFSYVKKGEVDSTVITNKPIESNAQPTTKTNTTDNQSHTNNSSKHDVITNNSTKPTDAIISEVPTNTQHGVTSDEQSKQSHAVSHSNTENSIVATTESIDTSTTQSTESSTQTTTTTKTDASDNQSHVNNSSNNETVNTNVTTPIVSPVSDEPTNTQPEANDPTIYTTFESLIHAIRANKNGTFKVSSTLSADNFAIDDNAPAYVEGYFGGTVEGINTATIANLKKPLFESLANATVKNLTLNTVNIVAPRTERVGAVAGTVDAGGKVENVHVTGRISGDREVGGIAGRVDNGGALTHVSFNGHLAGFELVGGIAGSVVRGSQVHNARTSVTIGSTSASNQVKLGGLVGNVGLSTDTIPSIVTNSTATGTITNYSTKEYSGDLFGHVEHTAQTAGNTETVKLNNGNSSTTHSKNTPAHPLNVTTNLTAHETLINTLATELNQLTLSPALFNQHNITIDDYDKRFENTKEAPVTAQEKINQLFLNDSFNATKEKTNLVNRLKQLITADPSNKTTTRLQQLTDKQKKQLLVGLAYVERWYNFGGLQEHLFQLSPNLYGTTLDMLLEIGSAPTSALDSRLTATAYTQFIAPYTNQATVVDFIKQHAGNNVDDWLQQHATAHIYRTASNENGKAKILERLSKPKNTHMILPLFSGKNNNVYAAFTTDSVMFGNRGTQTENIKTAATRMQRFFDTVRRIVNEPSKERLNNTNLIVFDDYGHSLSTTDKAFLSPIGVEHQTKNVNAHAMGQNVYLVLADIFTESGVSTLTHEHVHNIDNAVLLNGYGLRGSNGKENYALGLFQSLGPNETRLNYKFGFNWAFEKSNDSYRTFNATPDRFKTTADLQQYYKGVFDVLYTLERAEADALIQTGSEFIHRHYHQLKAKNYTYGTQKYDEISAIPTSINFTDWSDLITHNIVSKKAGINDVPHYNNPTNRYYYDTTYFGNNGYHTVSLFESKFGILENQTGHSGGYTLRYTAFELLAEKGYYEGMVPYISNQYGAEYSQQHTGAVSDTFILNKLFGNTYNSFQDFRKAMLERRRTAAQESNSLRAVTYDNKTITNYQQLVELFKSKMNNNFHEFTLPWIKMEIFKQYLKLTNDFRESIYTNTNNVN